MNPNSKSSQPQSMGLVLALDRFADRLRQRLAEKTRPDRSAPRATRSAA